MSKSSALRVDEAYDQAPSEQDQPDILMSGYYGTLSAAVRRSLLADAMPLSLDHLIAQSRMLIASSHAGTPV